MIRKLLSKLPKRIYYQTDALNYPVQDVWFKTFAVEQRQAPVLVVKHRENAYFLDLFHPDWKNWRVPGEAASEIEGPWIQIHMQEYG